MDKIQGVKRMILYCRVSTTDQADHGYSLPTQLDSVRRYVDVNKFIGIEGDAVSEFAEDCSGAIPFAERPVGKRIGAMLKRGEADGIVVHQVDRLSRDIVDVLTSVRNWVQSGYEIHSCDIGKVGNETDITLVIKAWQGNDERKKIVERTSRGRNGKARSGKVVGNGKPPYGYTYDDGQLVVNESEAQIVRQIYTWYLGGEDKGPMGSHSIAKRLTEMRVPVPDKRQHLPGRNTQGIWNISQIRKMLSSETYAGIWRFGKTIGSGGRRGRRQIDEQIVVEVPPIISHDLWEMAQAQRDYNVKMSRRNVKREYLLRGMVRCGCGKVFVGAALNDRGYYIYRCNSMIKRFVKTDGSCHESLVHGDRLEAIVWQWILGIITDPVQLESNLRQAQADELAVKQPKCDELGHVNALIAQAEAEADENIALMKCVPRNGIRYKKLEAEGLQIEARHTDLIQRRETLQAEIETQAITDENITNLVQFGQRVKLGLENPTFEQKRRWLEWLRTEITISHAKGVITCRLPVEPYSFDLNPF